MSVTEAEIEEAYRTRDLAPDHPRMAEILTGLEIGPVELVLRTGERPHLSCYDNVARRVQADSGRLVMGWMLEERPGAFVSATHHAVWQSPQGVLIDITNPGHGGEPAGSTTFVRDANPPRLDDTRMLLVETNFFKLLGHPLLDAQFAAYRVHNSDMREEKTIALAVGGKPYDWNGRTVIGTPKNLPLVSQLRLNAIAQRRAASGTAFNQAIAATKAGLYGDGIGPAGKS
jgi:hypothetical protein